MASESMTWYVNPLRCFHRLKCVCLLLICFNLVLITETKTNGGNRHKHRNGNQTNRNQIHYQGHQLHYDSPVLQEGNSFEPSNHRHVNRHKVRHRNQPKPEPEIPSPYDPFADPNITNDEDFIAKRQLRIEQIKLHILDKLNLKTPPNVSGVVESSNPSIKEWKEKVNLNNEKKEYENMVYQQDTPEEHSEKKIFIPVEEKYPFNYTVPDDTNIMYFKINPGEIKHAVMHLWIKPVPVFYQNTLKLVVYQVLKPRDGDSMIRMKKLSDHDETIHTTTGTWTRFPVFYLVSEWTKNPANNLGVVVQMKDMNENQVVVTDSFDMPDKAPLLEVVFRREGLKPNRTIRSYEGGKCGIGETKCCRFPLPINFTEHNFDFIVAPKVYMANFCSGKCDYLYAQQYLHVAMVQKLHNSTATYGPCCGAKQLMSLSMLYYDHDRKIRFDVINDMIIETCSCD